LCAARPVECLDQAIKRRSVARALRDEVSSDDLASLRARLVGWSRRSREFEKPEVEKPEVEKPEVEKPEVEKPEVEKPEVEK
jgi:hypothetical protein